MANFCGVKCYDAEVVTLSMEEEDGQWYRGDKMDLLTLTGV